MFGDLKSKKKTPPPTPSSEEEGALRKHFSLLLLFRGGGRGVVAALTALALAGTSAPAPERPAPERPAAPANIAQSCAARDGWSDPAPPAHIHGHTWYVGTCGITVVLIETTAGLVLIDAGPAEAAPVVLANIRALRFDPRQVKWILSTHEHFDHSGGIAALQAATGARLAAGPFAAQALRSGKPYADDPQLADLTTLVAPARVSRVLRSGEALVLGGTRFTAHATPAHSSGSTSWTWRSCEDGKCLTIAEADSVTARAAAGYRFTAHPRRVAAVRRGLAAVAALPCDLMLTPHPGASNLFPRLTGQAPLAGPSACRAYAAAAQTSFAALLAKERKGQ